MRSQAENKVPQRGSLDAEARNRKGSQQVMIGFDTCFLGPIQLADFLMTWGQMLNFELTHS